MIKGILDTDILSEIGKTVDKTVARNAAVYLGFHAQLTFTSVSVYEVLYGLNAKRAARQIQNFFAGIAAHEEIVPDKRDYRLAAEICAAMQLGGTPIGSIDPIIAACAINRDLPLITGNTRHHGYIRGAGFDLQLLNWRNANSN